MDYLKDLNPPQREAVLHGDGPLLILAGAGSGKTRVITYRIAHLIRERNVRPGNILAVTFTNKAATEMRERLERLLNIPLRGLWISTFHAACVRILRQHVERIGYKRQFVIYDETDRSSLIKTCMQDLRHRRQTVSAACGHRPHQRPQEQPDGPGTVCAHERGIRVRRGRLPDLRALCAAAQGIGRR